MSAEQETQEPTDKAKGKRISDPVLIALAECSDSLSSLDENAEIACVVFLANRCGINLAPSLYSK